MQYDKNFLLALDREKNKTVYARITKLTFDEFPIESIEGKVTGGSINIDGASALRRTCSLTLLADGFKYSDFYCGLNTKFKLEIGVENSINSNYPNIIWFQQGIYLVVSSNTSRSINNFSISISGKDKMCLLNGDVGGALTSSVDFGQIEEEDIYGDWSIKKIPIKDIIRNAVHIYGKEPHHNIIINDLEDCGVELLEYRYDVPLYLYGFKDSNIYTNVVIENEDFEVFDVNNNIFDLEAWADSSCNAVNDGGTVQVNEENGTITITASNAAVEDCYTLYGSGSSYYLMNIEAGREYIFYYKCQGSGVKQAYVFFYDNSGQPVGVNTSGDDNWFYNTTGKPIIFTPPAGATKMALRVGVRTKNATVTFSDLKVIAKQVLKDIPDENFESLATIGFEDNALKGFYLVSNTASGDEVVQEYKITKIQYGETAGYRITDLTYAGDLIAKTGESLTSVLDKIKNMLVEFEYFYNVDGQFVFQKKPSTVSVMQNLNPQEENTIIKDLITTNNIYTFEEGRTLTSLNINPNLLNIKNDYAIWGERKTASGATIPIHMRYAIDKKPIQYKTIAVSSTEEQVVNYANKHNIIITGQTSITYKTGNFWNKKSAVEYECDWREVLYRMAADYYKYNFLTDFYKRVAEANGNLYINGITSYENYYTDIYSFWRDIYNPVDELIEKETIMQAEVDGEISNLNNQKTAIEKDIVELNEEIDESTVGSDAYNEAITERDSLQSDLDLINIKLSYLDGRKIDITKKIENLEVEKENYYDDQYGSSEREKKKRCWNKFVFTQSYNLNFWFDFLDTRGVLSQYNIGNIGARTKSVNENTLKSLTYNKIPNIIYCNNIGEIEQKNDYAYVQIGTQYDNMFSISGQGKSVQDRLNELINNNSFYLETATINAIPIYYLEPNSRILLTDKGTGLNDIYLVNKITLPLTYNGTMSISANKIYDSLI